MSYATAVSAPAAGVGAAAGARPAAGARRRRRTRRRGRAPLRARPPPRARAPLRAHVRAHAPAQLEQLTRAPCMRRTLGCMRESTWACLQNNWVLGLVA
jgi:hypothetical protein